MKALCLLVTALALGACGGGGGNGGGSTTPPTVNAPSGLGYPTASILMVGSPMPALTPTVTGTVTSYSVSPALPAGLQLNATTGVMSGTPSVFAAATAYTVTASNSGGSTTATVMITVNDTPPAFIYPSASATLSKGISMTPLAPTNNGGAVAIWSIAPELPAGLTFSATSGTISGTPNVSAAKATYTVVGTNSGGTSSFDVQLSVSSRVALELGHATTVNTLQIDGTRMISEDNARHWALWNYATGAVLAQGDIPCSLSCTLPAPSERSGVALAGPTALIRRADQLEVRASSDGHLLSRINVSPTWWTLAADGSYVAAGNASGFTAWSPAGQTLFSRAGNYAGAAVFAAPTELRIAGGAAGASVVETITISSGATATSPAFLGQFNSWFADGERFLTNTGNTVWVYSKTATQQDLRALPNITGLGGSEHWFWTSGNGVAVYEVGASAAPAATFPLAGKLVVSGSTLGIVPTSGSSLTIVDLTAGTPTSTTHAIPQRDLTAYGAIDTSTWAAGNANGVVVDGASISGTPRYLAYGRALSIAGSDTRFAIATAAGVVFAYDAQTLALEQSIDSLSAQLQLSDDGTVLASLAAEAAPDRSIRIYSLPSAAVTKTWSYSASSPPTPNFIALSASGGILGQSLNGAGGQYLNQVTDVNGTTTLWSEFGTSSDNHYLRMSPDGTRVAAITLGYRPAATANIFNNGSLTTAVSGLVVGWLDNNHLLANRYEPRGVFGAYLGCTIYDATGVTVGTCSFPELQSVQAVGPDAFYTQTANKIYSITTGTTLWSSGSPIPSLQNAGAVAGDNVIFVTGATVVAEEI